MTNQLTNETTGTGEIVLECTIGHEVVAQVVERLIRGMQTFTERLVLLVFGVRVTKGFQFVVSTLEEALEQIELGLDATAGVLSPSPCAPKHYVRPNDAEPW